MIAAYQLTHNSSHGVFRTTTYPLRDHVIRRVCRVSFAAAAVWRVAPEGTYTDRPSHAEGREAPVELMGDFLQKFPGAQIVPTSHADFHHGMLRFTWQFIGGDGKTVTEGIDFVVGNDGRLQRIVGFSGPIKPL
jgi:hypothetical protein